ncbi:MAG: DUF3990 domain-containing protein [Ruminococcaceae bacterium]|nr:DUF3990 domain-containing protein [Oscillospiraceae bacterium]
MIVYHGSTVIVSKPLIIQQDRYLDFGFGFYTTTICYINFLYAKGNPWVILC